MRFGWRWEGLDRLRAAPGETAARVDEAGRRTVRILQQLGTRALRDRLSGEDRDVRTGNLRRSVVASEPTRAGTGGWEGRFGYGSGPSERYARVLEEGGTIVPKNGRVLAMPIGAGLTAGGRARYASPRDVEGGFWLSRPGLPPLFLVSHGGAGKVKRLDLLFVGLPKATIRGKHSAREAAREAQSRAEAVLAGQMRQALGFAA